MSSAVDDQLTGPSLPEQSEQQLQYIAGGWDIFLSHSGAQKGFAKGLFEMLNPLYNVFFDVSLASLPPADEFPPRIFHAAKNCRLALVVLSKEFICSKWPMMELSAMTQSGVKILPLFYELSPEHLKDEGKLQEWRRQWEELASTNARIDVSLWADALRRLRSINGVIFSKSDGELAYLKKIVSTIYLILPPLIKFSLAGIHGADRLCKEVAMQFQEAARKCDEVCIIGLYGVGGMGKTTMCNVMCNFYAAEYPGRSHHIEFPSDGNVKKITKECVKALKTLTNLSDEHLWKKADSFDQVVQLMRKHLRQYDVFLAIDNVWDSCVEAANKMLGVGFSAKSKILLTSRSDLVVKDLVRGHSNTRVRPLPSPDQEEALQLFQETFELGDLSSLVDGNLLHSVLKKCCFSGHYHALALKAVGQHVKRVCELEGLNKIEHCLSDILQGVGNDRRTIFQKVDEMIKLNYVNLAEKKKHMFLDIVVVVMAAAWSHDLEVTYEEGHQWLRILYKEQYSESTISRLIYELSLDGLIQLENIDGTSSKKMIRVHELYSDLAQREAARSSRFFIDSSLTTRSVKEIKWERLERAILSHHSPCFFKELPKGGCRNLQVLSAENIDLRSGIHLDMMPSLCVLKLASGNLTSIENWSAATGLAIVNLRNLHCAGQLKPIPSVPCLETLIVENVKTVQGLLNLDGCQHLRKLVLAEASMFKDWKANFFSSLTKLESLQIKHFNSITRVLNLSGLTCLERLVLWDNKSMEEVVGGLGPALKKVVVGGCEALKRMPDLRGLTCLERLELWDNKSMEEVVGGLGPALKEVGVGGCEALKRMPDLRGLTCLERLVLWDNKSMEEVVVEGLGPALKGVHVQ